MIGLDMITNPALPTEFRLNIDEHQVWPTFYAEDEDNPTPEEIAENDRAYRKWEEAGGTDLRRLRANIIVGAPSSFSSPDFAGLKQKSIQSPHYIVSNTVARDNALKALLSAAHTAMGHYLRSEEV